MNIQISKELHTTMSQPFYSDAKKAKNVLYFFFFLVTFSFPRDFSGTIADTDIINTPPEPFRPTDVPFMGYKPETKDLGRIFGCKINF